jgi:hypothetical protein
METMRSLAAAVLVWGMEFAEVVTWLHDGDVRVLRQSMALVEIAAYKCRGADDDVLAE